MSEEKALTITKRVGPWPVYQTTNPDDPSIEDLSYDMDLHDRRKEAGQVNIVMAPNSGHLDDFLDVLAEIGTHPEDAETHTPALHISQGDELTCSVFSEGDDLLLRLDTGVTLEHIKDGLYRLRNQR